MRDILDPADRWVGIPGAALAFGNKRPVALDDALTILKDSAPVTVTVLANDFDPEGGVLTLISASAILGSATAEPDNTVTYTPPPGLSGFDTVVYEIADDEDQRQTAQINITITDPQLSIDVQPNNTLVVTAETGLIDITVTNPAQFAGTYQADTADLQGGPVNLVVPGLTGTGAEGEVLTAAPGLWIYDTSDTPTQSWQWRRGGTDIPGAQSASYTVSAADAGQSIGVIEVLSDTFGQRFAASAEVSIAGGAFAPDDDAALIGWWDASDAATLTATGGAVSAWADKAGGDDLVQNSPVRQPSSGTRLLNGLNVIDFSSGFLQRTETLPGSGNVAFHIAMDIDGSNNAFEALLAVNATNDFQLDANNAMQFDGRLNAAGIGGSINLSGGPFSGGLILSLVFDLSSGTSEVFVANVSRGSASYTTAIDPAATLYLMTNRSVNAFADGAIAEVIITGDVSPSNRAAHHAYLVSKWGLT